VNPKEKLIWSIALPGFGQLLNGKYLKGILFISLEFVINVRSHFNELIMLSFNGELKTPLTIQNINGLCFIHVFTFLRCGTLLKMQVCRACNLVIFLVILKLMIFSSSIYLPNPFLNVLYKGYILNGCSPYFYIKVLDCEESGFLLQEEIFEWEG
jgi:hypothetical protein